MRKNALCIFIFTAALSSLFFCAHAQEDMTQIDNSVFEKPSRMPAAFKHDEHNETAEIEECNECHHIYKDGIKLEDESSEDQRCVECHNLKPSGEILSLRKAYHLNCRGCHKKKRQGPLMCGECHIKKVLREK